MFATHWSSQAKLLRSLILRSTTAAGSGHPTSSLSMVDVATVLFDSYIRYDIKNPRNKSNDRFILSKGHASPLLYSLFAMSGAYPLEDIMSLRKFNSPYEGHPTAHYPYAEAATGSLGQGLSVGAGIALGLKRESLAHTPKVYVVLGDGEVAEGQVWEACNFANKYSLSNLIAIVDVNRLGQSQETMFGTNAKEYANRFKSFGFQTMVIDGHSYDEIDAALRTAQESIIPVVIIASTKKGKGVSLLEDKDDWHGKALDNNQLISALQELGELDVAMRFTLKDPSVEMIKGSVSMTEVKLENLEYTLGEEVATREVYGKTLINMAREDSELYVLDGDVKNSTYSIDFAKKVPERFIECFIAEQNMVSVGLGLFRIGKNPYISTFASFFTRAADQIRMASISGASIGFAGSHVGVSIGEDGPSQMGLEDISLFGSIPESIVLSPSDAVSMTKLLSESNGKNGIRYIRMLRSKTPVIYENDEDIYIGGSKILKQSSDDVLTVAATGICVHEALKAYEMLQKEGISIRVVDCYSIKPLDKDTLSMCVEQAREKILITVEDHFSHGGFGDFVLDAFKASGIRIEKLAVDHISRSGSKEELLADAGIDAQSIIHKVKEVL